MGEMIHKALYVTAVQGIRISEDLGRGDQIDDGLFLINNRDSIAEAIGSHDAAIRRYLGQLGRRDLVEAPLIVCRDNSHYGDLNSKQADGKRYLLLRETADKVELFFLFVLWLIKDNACSTTPSYLITEGITTHDPYTVCSAADGKRDECELSRIELRKARDLYRQIRLRPPIVHGDEMQRDLLTSERGRLAQAIHFLTAARLRSFLSVKVANYFTALESLLLTDSSKIAEQLKVRVAMLLSENQQEQQSLYSIVGKAWDIRCSLVHGATTRQEQEQVLKASQSCDDILRRLFLLLFDAQSQVAAQFNPNYSPALEK